MKWNSWLLLLILNNRCRPLCSWAQRSVPNVVSQSKRTVVAITLHVFAVVIFVGFVSLRLDQVAKCMNIYIVKGTTAVFIPDYGTIEIIHVHFYMFYMYWDWSWFF